MQAIAVAIGKPINAERGPGARNPQGQGVCGASLRRSSFIWNNQTSLLASCAVTVHATVATARNYEIGSHHFNLRFTFHIIRSTFTVLLLVVVDFFKLCIDNIFLFFSTLSRRCALVCASLGLFSILLIDTLSEFTCDFTQFLGFCFDN